VSQQQFSLKLFPAATPLSHLEITGNIARGAYRLTVRFTVLGRLADIAIPASAATPVRRGGLWEETCLELFLGVKSSRRYWEFNLSPAGHWNVYRFAGYRKGRQEETAYTTLPFLVEIQPSALSLALDVALDRIIPAGRTLEVGICAVIQDRSGQRTYWALTHRGQRADFHRRDSFMVEL
jgi:hypothetical protein